MVLTHCLLFQQCLSTPLHITCCMCGSMFIVCTPLYITVNSPCLGSESPQFWAEKPPVPLLDVGMQLTAITFLHCTTAPSLYLSSLYYICMALLYKYEYIYS